MKGKKIGSSLLKVFFLLASTYVIYSLFGNKEGFQLGSSLDYNIGEGIDSSWTNKSGQAKPYNLYRSLEDNVGGQVPLPEGELLIFKENKYDPKCCPSVYSNSTGCVCATPEQMSYLNQRGGNRTFSSLY